MEYPLDQSAWVRGWSDTKTAWTDWKFFIPDAVVGVVIGSFFGWYWGLAVVVFGMLCAWLAIMITTPVRQRNEARRLLSEIPSKRKGIADKLADFYVEGMRLRQSLSPSSDKADLIKCKQWAMSVIEYIRSNPDELGESRAVGFVPDHSEMVGYLFDVDGDEQVKLEYALLSHQTLYLKKLVEEFLR